MPSNFYSGKDADIVAGSANFSTLITATATAFGLTAAQATSYGTLNTALQTAWTAASTPSTRTSVTIHNKDLAIRNMRALAIPLAKIIYATATVTDGQLV